MKNHQSQSGFTAIHLLLSIVLLGIIGFTGWKVYSTGQTSKTAESSTPTPAVKKDQTKPASTIPDGFIEYQNKDLGFKFAYPKEWGEVKKEEGVETKHLVSGSEYQLRFTLNGDVKAGTRSKDWKHGNIGHGGIIRAAGFTESTLSELVKGGFISKYSTDTSLIVSGTIDGESCLGVGSVLVHNLGNTTYPSLAFLYFDKKVPDDLDNTICHEDQYRQYLMPSHLEQLKKIDSSINALN